MPYNQFNSSQRHNQEKLGLFRNGVLAEIVFTTRAVAENRIIGLMNSGNDSDWEIYPL